MNINQSDKENILNPFKKIFEGTKKPFFKEITNSFEGIGRLLMGAIEESELKEGEKKEWTTEQGEHISFERFDPSKTKENSK